MSTTMTQNYKYMVHMGGRSTAGLTAGCGNFHGF